MSIELRHGIFENFDGKLEHSSNLYVFDVNKIWINQRCEDKDGTEVFTLYLSEANGTVHKVKLFTTDQKTEITLTPDAERRFNSIPQAARGSIVDMVVPVAYRSDDVVKNTTPNN